MKRKEFLKDARAQDKNELHARVRSNSEEQMKLRFRKATGQLQETHRIKSLKRARARMLTIANKAVAPKAVVAN